MSPMHYYLYYKSDIILSKTDGLLRFQCECQFVNKLAESDVVSYFWHVQVCSAGTTYFSEKYFKAMFSFHWISVLLISVTFYTYLASIVFFCATWPSSS